MKPAEFWACTPYETRVFLAGHRNRSLARYDLAAWQAHTTAALGRVKPHILNTWHKRYQRSRHGPRTKTWQQQLKVMESFMARQNAREGKN